MLFPLIRLFFNAAAAIIIVIAVYNPISVYLGPVSAAIAVIVDLSCRRRRNDTVTSSIDLYGRLMLWSAIALWTIGHGNGLSTVMAFSAIAVIIGRSFSRIRHESPDSDTDAPK